MSASERFHLDAAIHELADWLRIPSVSTAGGNPEALVEAAGWALRKIEAAGGSGGLVQNGDHPPLVVAELAANRDGAPTVLIYGHYDVPPPATSRAGPRRRSSPTSATAASTPAAPPTTRATSCRCCSSPASWPTPASSA